MAASRSPKWAMAASSLTSCMIWMPPPILGDEQLMLLPLVRCQGPHPLCFLGKSPLVQFLLRVYPCSIIRASSSRTSWQSAALCTALASRLAATGWLKKLALLITYTTENQETINQYSNKCMTA
jgi:hypothetical protein